MNPSWQSDTFAAEVRHHAAIEYAEELMRAAGLPGLTREERAGLLEEARAAEAVAFQTRRAA